MKTNTYTLYWHCIYFVFLKEHDSNNKKSKPLIPPHDNHVLFSILMDLRNVVIWSRYTPAHIHTSLKIYTLKYLPKFFSKFYRNFCRKGSNGAPARRSGNRQARHALPFPLTKRETSPPVKRKKTRSLSLSSFPGLPLFSKTWRLVRVQILRGSCGL